MQVASQKKTTVTFSIIVGLFLLSFLLLGLLIWQIFPIIKNIIQTSILGRVVSTCDCAHHAAFLTSHPYLGIFIILLSLLIIFFAAYVAMIAVKHLLATRRFKKNIIAQQVRRPTKLSMAASSLGLEGKVVAIASNSSEVFCLGFIRPQICISVGLVKRVSKAELRAILLHEKNHLVSRDPGKLFLVNLISQSLFFIPGIQHLIKQFKVGFEVAADERATNNFREVKSLSRALLKIIELHQRPATGSSQPVAVTHLSVTEERINRLIGQDKLRFTWFIPRLVISLLVIVSLFVLVFNGQALLAKTTNMRSAQAMSSATCPMMSTEQGYFASSFTCGYHSTINMSCANEPQLNLCY